MPPHIFAKLFPKCITTDGAPTRLCLYDTRLIVYNGSPIPQFGALETAIEWSPKCHQCSKHLHDQMVHSRQPWTSHTWSPFLIKTGNFPAETVQSNSHTDVTHPVHPRNLQQNVLRSGMTLTVPPNSSEDLIKPYPDQLEAIGQYLGTYQITLHDDAKPVVHAPRKCPDC